MEQDFDLIIVGGGAAGFFTAIRTAEKNPSLRIAILEKSDKVLSKVRISGGGRCNVTHACFDPKEMVTYYPRGHKELLGPFHTFLCGDMMSWLEEHGVPTKIEEDGRVFPVSDSSASITDCFEQCIRKLGIRVHLQCGVQSMKSNNNRWEIATSKGSFVATKIMVASGSSPAMWQLLATMGCTVIPPVPSLFTFNVQHHLLKDLQGVAVPSATVTADLPEQVITHGPLLITHWGLSGPAVLRASAVGAIAMHASAYRFPVSINWTGWEASQVEAYTREQRTLHGGKKVSSMPAHGIPKRLWERLAVLARTDDKNWSDLSSADIERWTGWLTASKLPVNGKSTFKDEFVTAGGVDLRDIRFTTMEHKHFPGLYFAGEVLNIDAVTGGFNFQAAWTTAEIAATAIAAAP